MVRLRRLCSRDTDFNDCIEKLKICCANSGYNEKMVSETLTGASSLQRTLIKNTVVSPQDEKINIRLVVLSGTGYENEFKEFAKRMNTHLSSSPLKIEIVNSTGSTLGQYLFNNNNNRLPQTFQCGIDKCVVCPNNLLNQTGNVCSSIKGTQYEVNQNLGCSDGGIYVIEGACFDQYTGKTVHFGQRCIEHLQTSTSSSIFEHKRECQKCNIVNDFKITYVEHYHDRGKYSSSEREMLWNHRLQGHINVQKTLTNSKS